MLYVPIHLQETTPHLVVVSAKQLVFLVNGESQEELVQLVIRLAPNVPPQRCVLRVLILQMFFLNLVYVPQKLFVPINCVKHVLHLLFVLSVWPLIH